MNPVLLAAAAPDFSGLISAFTSAITAADLLGVIAQVVGIGIPFFLVWLGVRIATRGFTSAVSSGRLRM